MTTFSDKEIISKHFPGFARRHYISTPHLLFIAQFKEFVQKYPEFSTTKKKNMNYKLEALRMKLASLEYHDKNIHKIEKWYKKTSKSLLQSLSIETGTLGVNAPEIAFELEAYLFQTKASLDIFSNIIGSFFKQNISSISKLKNVLNNNKQNNKAQDLLNLINKNSWIEEYISKNSFEKTKRDTIAHYGKINLSPLNIIKKGNKKYNTIRTKVEKTIVLNYTKRTNKRIQNLCNKSFKILQK